VPVVTRAPARSPRIFSSSVANTTYTITVPLMVPSFACPSVLKYVMRCIERETFFGRDRLDLFDQGVVDAFYDLLWARRR
jgi:hypothetical protein